jgi:hypothetical protein
MAESINFRKERARYFLDRLASGRPIEGPWTFDDMMMLAGVLLFCARSHGSLPHRLRGLPEALAQLPEECLISTDAQFLEDSTLAVEFYAHLAQLVQDGEYDRAFEPQFAAFVYMEDGERKIRPVTGAKGADAADD